MLSTKLNFLQNWTHIDLNINLNQAKMIEAAIIYSYVCFYSMSIPLFVHLKKKNEGEEEEESIFTFVFPTCSYFTNQVIQEHYPQELD